MQFRAQLFLFGFMIEIGREECSNLGHFLLFSAVWVGPFPQVSGQVMEWPMLELHKIIRMLHVVSCPIVFLLFYERGWQEEGEKML